MGFCLDILKLANDVKNSAKCINFASSSKKNEILRYIKENITSGADIILKANEKDVKNAMECNLKGSFINRLALDSDKIKNIAESIDYVIALKDPVNRILNGEVAANGLKIEKISLPLGVVGIIYEARPNVTVDAAVISIKSGNAVILRGGKEAINTNTVLVDLIKKAILKANLNPNILGFVADTSRESAMDMMKLNDVLDVLIPRGGAGLINTVVNNASVPVIQTGVGNCHIYVDEFADLDMALKIVINAKVSRPSVCNAAESLLIHDAVANKFLTRLNNEFIKLGVTLYGCSKSCSIVAGIKPAKEEDYFCEYLDLKMSVKIVSSVEQALQHIAKYSSHHSEAIITSNYFVAEYFLDNVDSAAVYVNASTRFTDGAEFGLGAEIGISTQKLHARGPMGLDALTTTKFIVRGNGQTRE